MYIPVIRGRVAIPGVMIRGGSVRDRGREEDLHTAVRVMPAQELRPGRLPNGLPEHVRRPRFVNKSRNNIRLVL